MVETAETDPSCYVTHVINLANAGDAKLIIHVREYRRSHRAKILGEGSTEDETGVFIWASSYVLARWIVTQTTSPTLLQGRVMELGSGCGLVGLAVARMGRASTVMLTDLHENTLSNLRHNVVLNERDALDDSAAGNQPWRSPNICPINWNIRASWPQACSIDNAYGADLVYDDGMAAMLAGVLQHSLRVNGEFMHVHPARGRVGTDEMASIFRAAGLELVFEGDVPPHALQVNATDGSLSISASGNKQHSMWHVFNEVTSKRFILQRYRKTQQGVDQRAHG